LKAKSFGMRLFLITIKPKTRLNQTFENPNSPKKLATKIVKMHDTGEDSSNPEKIYSSLINFSDPGIPE
jgi:hypothetical protein